MDDQFAFSDDDLPGTSRQPVWRVLGVDDDADFQRATAFALSELELLGGRIELIQAFSCCEASMLLAKHHDIALAACRT